MPPRVICFIDGSNLYSHLRDVFGSGKVRLSQLCHELTGPTRKLLEWRYYAAPIPQGTTSKEKQNYAGQQRFFGYIRRHRKGSLHLGRFQRDADGRIHEKGVDVRLAVDLVRLAAENRYDVAIVLSGDGDLVPAVESAQQLYGKRVETALPDVPAYHILNAVPADARIRITSELFQAVKL